MVFNRRRQLFKAAGASVPSAFFFFVLSSTLLFALGCHQEAPDSTEQPRDLQIQELDTSSQLLRISMVLRGTLINQ